MFGTRPTQGVLSTAAALLFLPIFLAEAQVRQQNKPTQQQAAPSTPANDLVLTIDEPRDWSPSGGVQMRGITANVRSSIRVTGTARHPAGVQEILLNKNRASIADMGDGSTQFVGYVRVEERMTSAEVTVVTKNGTRIPTRYTITPVEPPKPDPKPENQWAAKTAEAGFHGKRWAVIIGISKYEDKDIPSLKYADADAKEFYDFLRSPLSGMGGFDPENIKILLNENATYRNMRVALFDFLKNATAEDVVYIYFAGHGSPDPQRLQNQYLLPYDAKQNSIAGTSFPMEDMNKALRQVAAAHKILIADACHSGGIATEATRAGLSVNEINSAFLDRMGSSNGVHMMFTASNSTEQSAEGEQWGGGHGVFTHYLIEGLQGAADADSNSIVDLHEMVDYTSRSVERATTGAQHPTTGSTAYNESFPVALVLPNEKITPIPMEEIERALRERNITDKADETPWIAPDSAVLVAGMPDTLFVRLQTPDKEVIPASWLTWSTSNAAIATVDKEGTVHPLAGGTVTITAARGARKVQALMRVLPRPSDVQFFPQENELELVLTESFRVRSDLLVGPNQWVRDMAPRIAMADTLVLRQQGGLEFVALREGTTKLSATIGGKTREWTVHVIPPAVKINAMPVSVPLNDSIAIGASRVRPSDKKSIGDAPQAVWRSLDTTRAVVRGGRLVTTGIGRATIVATLGNSADTISTFVLGDLLVGTDGNGGQTIQTMGISSGRPTPLLAKGTPGGEPALSPRGDKIAFVSNKRLFIMDADGSNVHRLTPDMKGMLGVRMSSYEEHSPSWTADGSRVVYISNAHGNYEVLSVTPDGKEVQRLTSDDQHERSVATAPDQPRIAFERATAFDESEIVVALPDGAQQQSIPSVQTSIDRKFRQIKPKFMPGGKEVLVVRRWGRDGESLHLVRVDSGMITKDLVREVRDNGIIYAVSPDGQTIAYHLNAEWGKSNNAIVIIDRNGGVLKTINLGAGLEIKTLGWGASPIRPKEAK